MLFKEKAPDMPQHPYKTSIKVGGLTVLCLFLLASYPLQALADLEDIPDVGLPGRRVGEERAMVATVARRCCKR
uniref:Uncharacterized protein n=1 Tax=Desertifilum tharense IPPAS B-1220 TaxID=1781255 RepID=A0ACD5GPP5_9CYAN